MNKLVIIGNGFDLAHGMKTSYKDFILWYINEKVVKNFSLKDNTYAQFFPLKNSIPVFSSLKDFRRYLTENSNIKENYDHTFIEYIIKSYEIDNWVDFEYEYYQYLKEIYYRIENNQIDEKQKRELSDFNYHFGVLKMNLEEYLKQLPKQIFSDELSDDIKKHFVELKVLYEGEKFYFLNFNYTNTIFGYIDFFNLDRSQVNFIHGELNVDDNPIIFGYGDETDKNYEGIESINLNEFTKHFKSFGYLNSSNYQDLFIFLSSQEFEVHVMGHSCGISDRVLLSNIFQHENFKKLKIYYYQYGIYKLENDFFQKTQELSRHFDINSKHKMRTKIVPFNKSLPLTRFISLI